MSGAISCQELINKLTKEIEKTKRKVFVDTDNETYEIVDYYIDSDGDIRLEIGDEV